MIDELQAAVLTPEQAQYAADLLNLLDAEDDKPWPKQ
jgi:hypothetical protein